MNIIPSTKKDPAPNGIKHGKLHAASVDELRYRLDSIRENIDSERDEHGEESGDECAKSWADTIKELEEVLQDPTHEALSHRLAALEELELAADSDPICNRDMRKAWLMISKREWDQFIAEGGQPSDLVHMRVRLSR